MSGEKLATNLQNAKIQSSLSTTLPQRTTGSMKVLALVLATLTLQREIHATRESDAVNSLGYLSLDVLAFLFLAHGQPV